MAGPGDTTACDFPLDDPYADQGDVARHLEYSAHINAVLTASGLPADLRVKVLDRLPAPTTGPEPDRYVRAARLCHPTKARAVLQGHLRRADAVDAAMVLADADADAVDLDPAAAWDIARAQPPETRQHPLTAITAWVMCHPRSSARILTDAEDVVTSTRRYGTWSQVAAAGQVARAGDPARAGGLLLRPW